MKSASWFSIRFIMQQQQYSLPMAVADTAPGFTGFLFFPEGVSHRSNDIERLKERATRIVKTKSIHFG
jgi:1-acyl-sn-glycerol-3-phosphate acyltransferase